MFFITRHNASFGCPEFYRDEGGNTLHTDKAHVAESLDEAVSLIKTLPSDRWMVVTAEDVRSLPGY